MANVAKEPEDFLPLTPAEFHILLVLAEEDRHGYSIMKAVKKKSDGAINIGPGTLYSTLSRMLEREWIIELDERDDPEDDKRRRYYQLTDMGLRVARLEAERLSNVVNVARNLGLLGGGA